jgi:hypothetical protein
VEHTSNKLRASLHQVARGVCFGLTVCEALFVYILTIFVPLKTTDKYGKPAREFSQLTPMSLAAGEWAK